MTGRVLVTGACGFTGSNMIEYLSTQTDIEQIVATDLPGSQRDTYYTEAADGEPQPVYYQEVLSQHDVEFIPADLTDSESIRSVCDAYDYDVVFHIASLFDYFAEREALDAVNVGGVKNLLTALSEQETTPHVIHWSTLGVLGHAGFEEPKREDAEYNPHNRYCRSKVEQEQTVEDFSTEIDTTIIRPAPVYGPRHQYGIYHILKLLEKTGIAPVLRIHPRSKQSQFPSVHVLDVVRAAHYLAENPDISIGETYNLLSDPLPQDELMVFLSTVLPAKRVEIPVHHKAYSTAAALLYRLAVNREKAARARGTRPTIDAPMLHYLSHNMWFSNEKLKATGFEFTYQDSKQGLLDYIDWCRERGEFL